MFTSIVLLLASVPTNALTEDASAELMSTPSTYQPRLSPNGPDSTQVCKVVDALKKCPIFLLPLQEDSADYRAVIATFDLIGRHDADTIRKGIQAYLRLPGTSKSRNNMDGFDLYALNRFLFDIPATAKVRKQRFIGSRGDAALEAWPWQMKQRQLVLVDGADSIGNTGQYDPLADFDYLRMTYRFRSGYRVKQ